MIIKIINDTAEYNGLVPTLLVFKTFPRITNDDISTLFIIKRAKIIKMTMNKITKLHAKRQVNDTLYQRNDPQIMRIHDTPINSPILV